MNDDEFLANARIYVSDDEVFAACEMNENPQRSVHDVCADYGNVSLLVVMGLQGQLKEAVVRKGQIAPGDRYVDPWEEAACLDHDNISLLAAFGIYRTVERRLGDPQIFKRGTGVN